MVPALAQGLNIVEFFEMGDSLVLILQLVALSEDLFQAWVKHLLFKSCLVALRAEYFFKQVRSMLPIIENLKKQIFSSVSAC